MRWRLLAGTVLVVIALGALGWALVSVLSTPGKLIAVAYLLLLSAGVMLRGSGYSVWVAGVLAVASPAALLLLAQQLATDPAVRTAFAGLLYLYGAGVVGGLILELLQDKRYVLERPYLDTSSNNLPSPADHEVVRTGPRWNLGFLSRLVAGGVAGLTLVSLLGSTVGDLDISQATQPAALGWAVAAGAAAPAVWKQFSDMVINRSNAVGALIEGLGKTTPGSGPGSSAGKDNDPPPSPVTSPLVDSVTQALKKLN